MLVVGTDSLADEIATAGLQPVRRFDDEPDAVVQGLSMTIGWPEPGRGRAGHPGGRAVGGGQCRPHAAHRAGPVARQRIYGGRAACRHRRAEPQVAGKPGPQLMQDAVGRGEFAAPLVVGDRLDTDIEGANAAELPSLMVLTGVNSARDAVYAEPAQRPTYIGYDLRSLHQDGELLAVGPQPGWRVEVGDEVATVSSDWGPTTTRTTASSVVRAVASAVWDAVRPGRRSRPATTGPATPWTAGP